MAGTSVGASPEIVNDADCVDVDVVDGAVVEELRLRGGWQPATTTWVKHPAWPSLKPIWPP